MRLLILLVIAIVLHSNNSYSAQEPELIAFECKGEFIVGVPDFDGIRTTSGSNEGRVIRNFVLSTGATKDGYPTSNFEKYQTVVSDDMNFALVFFRELDKKRGYYKYSQIKISFEKPLPKTGVWSAYNNEGIVSYAEVSDVLIMANEYKSMPEKCRIKLSY